jgi:hypothetical protein
MKKQLGLAVLVVGGLSQLGASDCGGGPVLRDPGFDLWCGDELCTWKVVRGDVRRVGTWHDNDSGIELLGPDSAISQTSPVNTQDGSCIRFSLITNVEETADVFLDIDLEADGSVERSERIPTSNWKPISFLLYIGAPYDGIRFELGKRGTGKAVLAQIDAQLTSECEGLDPIDPGPRPAGAACVFPADCASGLCVKSPTGIPDASFTGTACVGCDPSLGAAACGAGETCGVGDPLSAVLEVPMTCVPTASRELAEQCISDAECASGKCSGEAGQLGRCSGCDTSTDCGGGACAPAWITDLGLFRRPGPDVCRPGEHAGTPGTACGADADCASNHCTGSILRQCNDGRSCETPANCPPDDGLAPGACTTVGIQGGSCD